MFTRPSDPGDETESDGAASERRDVVPEVFGRSAGDMTGVAEQTSGEAIAKPTAAVAALLGWGEPSVAVWTSS